jgi:hypothetical protein
MPDEHAVLLERDGRGPQHPPDGWSELNAEYQRRFEITPEEATPIPQM